MRNLLLIALAVLTQCTLLHAQYNVNPYRTIIVAQDGSGEFTTIQEAVNATRDLGPAEVLISIKAGVYIEKIVIPASKRKLTLKGDSTAETIISNADYSGKIDSLTNKKMNTFNSFTVLVQGDDIVFDNITIENTWCKSGQAVALHVEGDRFVFKNGTLKGCQDTLYTAKESSRQLYFNTYIEGTTDFLFGQATVVFKDCIIKSLKNSYITAAATTPNQEFGYVFLNCKLTANENTNKVYLGRPWRPYAKTVFLNCNLGKHIVEKGWDPWTGDKMFPNKEKTTFYAEYKSKGKGANKIKRASWTHQLSKKEAKKYTLKNIFKGAKDWNVLEHLK